MPFSKLRRHPTVTCEQFSTTPTPTHMYINKKNKILRKKKTLCIWDLQRCLPIFSFRILFTILQNKFKMSRSQLLLSQIPHPFQVSSKHPRCFPKRVKTHTFSYKTLRKQLLRVYQNGWMREYMHLIPAHGEPEAGTSLNLRPPQSTQFQDNQCYVKRSCLKIVTTKVSLE